MPSGDPEFDIFQRQFITFVQPNIDPAGSWDIPVGAFDPLLPLQTTWDTKWAVAQDKDSRTSADVEGKDNARAAYETALRAFVKEWITPNTNITDQERKDMNLTVPDTERSRVPVPANAPGVSVKEIKHLQHILRIIDPTQPGTRAKPDGVRSAQVYIFFGESEPGDNKIYTFYGNANRFKFTVDFDAADRGKLVWYIARWENTRGEVGPWSNPTSATVA